MPHKKLSILSYFSGVAAAQKCHFCASFNLDRTFQAVPTLRQQLEQLIGSTLPSYNQSCGDPYVSGGGTIDCRGVCVVSSILFRAMHKLRHTKGGGRGACNL